MTLSGIKAANTAGTWSGNEYNYRGVDWTILTDNADNVIGIKANGTANQTSQLLFGSFNLVNGAQYVVTDGTTTSGSDYNVRIGNASDAYVTNTNGGTATFTADTANTALVGVVNGKTANNIIFLPMIRLSTETDATYAPYSNICPISGRTGTTVSTRNADNTETASATISFGTTVYGGQVDFKTGNVTVEWGYIASYNGESLPGAWISDRDVYAAGTTPTTDAEVCYELATPTTLSLTPDILTMLKNNNSVSGDGVITITALTGDSWS